MSDLFASPDSLSQLSSGTVHIWRARIAGLAGDVLAGLRSTLAADEIARADRFHFGPDRDAYTAARGTLRWLIGRYLDCPAAQVEFQYGPRGKPSLANARDAGSLAFNVSHRGHFALLAFGRDTDLGVDIEELRDVPEALAIARSHFTPAETQILTRAAEQGQVRECFFRFWTRKESVIKAVGTGLSLPLSEFDVSSAAISEQDWQTVTIASRPGVTWGVRDLQLGAGYRGAICIRGAGATLAFANADAP